MLVYETTSLSKGVPTPLTLGKHNFVCDFAYN